jgi:hypothetical protein
MSLKNVRVKWLMDFLQNGDMRSYHAALHVILGTNCTMTSVRLIFSHKHSCYECIGGTIYYDYFVCNLARIANHLWLFVSSRVTSTFQFNCLRTVGPTLF